MVSDGFLMVSNGFLMVSDGLSRESVDQRMRKEPWPLVSQPSGSRTTEVDSWTPGTDHSSIQHGSFISLKRNEIL